MNQKSQEENHQTEDAILRTIEDNIILLDTDKDPLVETREIILNRRLEIQRSFHKSPPTQLVFQPQANNARKTLFSFTDFNPGEGRKSKPVQFGVNRTIEALNREFDTTKFSNGKLNSRWRIRPREVPSLMKIVGGLPVGTQLRSNQSRHILIGKYTNMFFKTNNFIILCFTQGVPKNMRHGRRPGNF